ncbi:hypothetical protein C9F11_43405 (plasmid) [Streptomyces sp. YIM 121038]|uniref:hypothetical protein n=1 Tax=Streptomyces sp. YIM 121038 TaxID=2136401 RepID=UPI001110C797|nr:hypothetical protein [Streptomyces sp. YIM 121038]QCX82261.1 hypothetical protein C9F11_43405 [Streptomyces sp. YIM 121038]
MTELADAVRCLRNANDDAVRAILTLTADAERVVSVGVLFDVVVFSAGRRGLAVIHELDAMQHPGCGPVIASMGKAIREDRFIALVPPRTARRWVCRDAQCFGGGTLRIPPPDRQAPPGRYWMRPFAGARQTHLVGPVMLHQALERHRPFPPPHPARAMHAM